MQLFAVRHARVLLKIERPALRKSEDVPVSSNLEFYAAHISAPCNSHRSQLSNPRNIGRKCDEVTRMSDEDRVAAYRDYYRARAARYAADPLYPLTAAAERRLCDAVEAASSMADLMQSAGSLALECGTALAADQANARAALYARTADTVRAQAPAEILAGLASVADAAALANLGSGAQTRADRAVTIDELTRLWTMSLVALENVQTWQDADVPVRWRGELDGYAADALRDAQATWAQVVATGQQHQPGWQFDPADAREQRHRRLLPVPDEPFEELLADHLRLVAGGQA
jgi:hypothetical protein